MIDGEVWLRSEGAEALILPDAGCRLGSLRVRGLELLRTEGERPAEWGSYPMVPWVGRMGGARFEFDGAIHEFPADAARTRCTGSAIAARGSRSRGTPGRRSSSSR